MPYKLASLLLSSEQKSSSIAKIAWAEADQSNPANEARFSRVGKIFSLVEVYATNAKSLALLDFFSERPKLNYYQQPDLDKNERPSWDDLEKFFTAAIQQTNNDLTIFLAEHKIDYLEPEVSATVGLLTEKGLFLASIGRNQVWMLLPEQADGKQIIKTIAPIKDGLEYSGRLFQEIFSGVLLNNSYCLISNEALAEYIEPTTALNLLANKSPLVGAEKLRHFLQQTNQRVDFLGLIIKRYLVADSEEEAGAKMPVNIANSSQSTTVQTQLRGNNLRLTEERTEKILNPSGWSKFSQLVKKFLVSVGQNWQKLIHRDWQSAWQTYYHRKRKDYLKIKEKINHWRGWPIIVRHIRRILLIGRTQWYKAQPKLQKVSNHLVVYWFKTAPLRCRISEKYWLPVERIICGCSNWCAALIFRFRHLIGRNYQPPRHYWQGLSKRSRLFLGLAGICLLLLASGMFWQYRRQIHQIQLRRQTEQVALVEQKHNQIEANLLYNNLTSANQSLDEVQLLISQWQVSTEKLPAEIAKRWQQAVLQYEKLLGQVRHIYTLRDSQVLAKQLVTVVSSTDGLIKLNGQLLAWTDSSSRQIFYQNSRQEWHKAVWPEGWQAIVAMTADGQSWYFVAGDGQIASLTSAGEWKIWPLDKPQQEIKALAFYGGRLYIIAQDNQIYRYQKQADNFNGGQKWNTDQLPDGKIVGLAVDGQVYVFYQDNKVLKLNNGRSQTITLQAPELPVKSWSDCQLLADSASFYCLETDNQRILHYHLDGAIDGQYKLAGANFGAAVISETKKMIYWLSNQGIQTVSLP